MRPSARRPSITPGIDLDDVADQADVDLLAVDHPPVASSRSSGGRPRRRAPTANGPCAFSRPTISRCTWPTSTIRTTSIVSGVVTRSPPGELLLDPELVEVSVDLGPAAVHDDDPDAGRSAGRRRPGRTRRAAPRRSWRGRRTSRPPSGRGSARARAAPRRGRSRWPVAPSRGSCRVGRVLVHVGRGQVVAPDGGGLRSGLEVDGQRECAAPTCRRRRPPRRAHCRGTPTRR